MNGRERLRAALRREQVDRVPWVPFVGCHAASLLGIDAQAYLKSEDAIVQGAQLAIDRYHPDGIPVMFDLQLEAETLGCELNWGSDNPPSVASHPLSQSLKLEDLRVPSATSGRIGITLAAARRLRAANPEIALYGLITGPFTLALHLLGTDIFMKMYDDAPYVMRLLQFCSEVSRAMAGYYIQAGCDVIAVVDPMTSQISARTFEEFVTPAARPVFDSIRRQGALSSFFVCGHAQQNVAAMCDCLPDNVSVDENIPLQFVREVWEAKQVSFGGNLQLTSVLLLGSEVDAQENALACLEIAGDCGFVLSPGCDLPFHTPPQNLEAVYRVVSDPGHRAVARADAGEYQCDDRLDLREYGQRDKVIIDIITLDSEACAPCQYMVSAVQKIAPQFDGIVEWREHKIKSRESLVFMTSLMVRNIPTICIDGQITFVSRIPPHDELVAAIQTRINEKFRMQLTRSRGTISVLGPTNDDQTKATRALVERAVAELGVELEVSSCDNEAMLASFGITRDQCPAVVTTVSQLRSVGQMPELVAVKEWIKQLR
jgi:uroporphyrinogen decarboxylase